MIENTQITAPSKQSKKAEIAYRRRLVAALYLSHVGEDEIARRVKVDQSTVSRDITWLKKQWTQQAVQDIDDFVIRELAELNEIEQQAAIEFGKSGGQNPRWLAVRLLAKDRKYKLLGLDKKVIELQSKKPEESLDEIREKRWRQVQEALAEVLNADQQQSGYNLITIEGGENGNDR
jgi:hypothetical protein